MIQKLNIFKKILDENIKTYIKNVLYSTFSHGLSIIISFITSIAITRALGVEGRGIMSWIMYFNILGLSLARMGMGQTSRRFIAEEPKRASDLALVSISICVIASLIIIPILYFIAMMNGIGKSNLLALMISLITIPFGAIATCIGEILVGLGDGKGYSHNLLLRKITAALLMFTIILLNIATPLTGVLASCTATFIMCLHAAILLKKHIYFKLTEPLWVLKNLKAYSFMSYISFISMLIARMIVPIYMGIVSTKIQTGLYSAIIILIEATYILPNMVSLYLLPEISKKSNSEKWKNIFKYSLLGTFFVITTGAGILYLMSNWLVVFLYGKEFIAGVPVFNILLLSLIFFTLGVITQSVVAARFKSWIITIAPISTAIVSFTSSKMLIGAYGAIGGAYTLTISMFTLFIISSCILYLGTSEASD